MDSPNRDPTPRFGESHQKSGTSGPDTRLAKATQGRPNSTQPARDRWRCSKPTDWESGTASGTALPLPSKTRRSRHKYSSRSQPSIDRPLPVPLYSPLSAILRLAALGLNPIPSQPLVY
ncbi:hypothetical protein PCASD_05831 [Puccinia coronata f. sp. avenae]|uniref:Uncharacterized protein n=1 Tax=Puccinia coronata f. sp. avenae TaxID=200324 RepID=A0A2N5V1E6_9BASI|nr:hypothetical protein PCASD_05831 [Puccinia coronata f. sp. avenae]